MKRAYRRKRANNARIGDIYIEHNPDYGDNLCYVTEIWGDLMLTYFDGSGSFRLDWVNGEEPNSVGTWIEFTGRNGLDTGELFPVPVGVAGELGYTLQ